MRHILFITSNSIGDAVLSSGVLDVFLRRPATRAVVLCGPLSAPLFAAMPHVAKVIIVRKKPFSLHWLLSWVRCCTTFWDTVIDTRGTLCGYAVLSRKRYIYASSHFPEKNLIHRVEELRRAMSLPRHPAPTLHATAIDRSRAKSRIARNTIAIAPFAHWPGKQWPGGNWAELCLRLTRKGGILAGAKVIIIGADSDRPQASKLRSCLRSSGVPSPKEKADFIGQSLPYVYACLRRCRIFIGNDSGPMHMAAAAGIPTLGLFGPTNDLRFSPWGGMIVRTRQSPHTLCREYERNTAAHHPYSHLMDSIRVDTVYRAVTRLIAP